MAIAPKGEKYAIAAFTNYLKTLRTYMQKSIFKSKGMVGSFVTIAFGFLTLIQSPAFHGQAAECLKVFGQNDLANAIALTTLTALAFSAGNASEMDHAQGNSGRYVQNTQSPRQRS